MVARTAGLVALLAASASGAFVSNLVRQNGEVRTAPGAKCAGAAGQEFIPFVGCTSGYVCTGAATDFGRICVQQGSAEDGTATDAASTTAAPAQSGATEAPAATEASTASDAGGEANNGTPAPTGTDASSDGSGSEGGDSGAAEGGDGAGAATNGGDSGGAATDGAAADGAATDGAAADGAATDGAAADGAATDGAAADGAATDDAAADGAATDDAAAAGGVTGGAGADDGAAATTDASDDGVAVADTEGSSAPDDSDDTAVASTADEIAETSETPEEDSEESPDESEEESPDESDEEGETPEGSDEDDGSACFPADATVEMQDGSILPISKVSVGDMIKVGGNKFSKVFMFTHKNADVVHKFVTLKTASGASLSLTKGHYIYADDVLVAASTVKVGSTVTLGNGQTDTVVAIGSKVSSGLFNPQTVHGDVVVDGIVSSTYTTAVEPTFAHAILAPFRFLNSLGLYFTGLESGSQRLADSAPNGAAIVF